jgi:hypothetical protein
MMDLSQDRISNRISQGISRKLEPRPGCPVCGCQQLYLDEVGAGKSPGGQGGLLLGECQRCDYRWTMPALANPLRGLWIKPVSSQEHAA